MIERVVIKNYKCIKNANIAFNKFKNIIVGNNGVGKSTLMEAVSLALGYGLNKFEVTPHIFNIESIQEYKVNHILPEILIEVYFTDDNLGELSGENNSLHEHKSGLYLRVCFNESYSEIYNEEVKNNSNLNIPCEYYKIERMWFSQQPVVHYKMPFVVQIVDSTSLYFSSSSNQYINQLIEKHLGEEDTTAIKTSLRHLKEKFDEDDEIVSINEKIAEKKQGLSISVDVTSKIEKRDIMCPFVDNIPVSQTGAGEICHLKTLLALSNGEKQNRPKVVIIEEPETHLSHVKMYEMLNDIERLLDESNTQVLITTHSSFVANKLDLSNLIMLERKNYTLTRNALNKDDSCYKFFSKVCHYPTLRLILSKAVILVEGPADEMVVTYYYYKKYQKKHPFNDGIELIAVGGVAFKEYVELLKNFHKKVAVITDNDGYTFEALLKHRGLENIPDNIEVFAESNTNLKNLEPSFVNANTKELQSMSNLFRKKKCDNDSVEDLVNYMENNKTEWSYKLLQCIDNIDLKVPENIVKAIDWVSKE